MNRRTNLTIITLAVFLVLFLTSCSNFLSDSRIDPDKPRLIATSASIDAVITAGVAEGATTAFSTVSFDISWDVEVTDFDETDITLENASLSSFAGSGRDYSFDLDILAEGNVEFTIGLNAVEDVDGNTNVEKTYSFVSQSSALTAVISTPTESILTNQASIPVEFLFSEDVTGFDSSDVNLTNFTLSGFTGSGDSYSGTLTFDADGSASVGISADVCLDDAESVRGNEPAAFSITYDGTDPTVALSSSISDGVTAGFRALIFTVLFSEDVTGLDSADFAVTNASLSNYSGSDDTYVITVTPLSDGPVSIRIPADKASDIAGNSNEASTLFTYTYDSSKIGIVITSAESTTTNATTVPLTFTFGSAVNGFEIGDIDVSGGTVSNFTGSDGDTVYTAEISPSGDGDITVSIDEDTSLSADSNGFGNVDSSYTFQFDGTSPATPAFELRQNGDSSLVGADTASDDFLKLILTSDYSGDTGSTLSFEYTLDDGSTWQAFSAFAILSSQGAFSGINIRTEDVAGNSTEGSAITGVSIDTVTPSSPTPSITTDPVNATNVTAFGFSITNAEEDAAFDWTVSSDSGGIPLSGSGIIGVGGVASVSNLDISGLSDGNILVQVTQTDAAGNTSSAGQDASPMDTDVPLNLVLTITSGDPVTGLDNDAFAFSFSGGEDGLEWHYSVASSGGGPTISADGFFDASGAVNVNDMDVSAIKDGTLSVTVTQEDAAGNLSTPEIDSIILDAIAVNDIVFPALIDGANEGSVILEMTGEDGSLYSYSISSSAGGTPLSDSGTHDATAQLNPTLDLSGLNDGYIVVLVDVTDISGNTAREFYVAQKDTALPPSTGTADFSLETSAVNFDASYHGYQSVPSGYVRFDTDDIIGSDHNDVLRFSALEDGEVFTLDGGAGWDILDVSNYLSDNITISEGSTDGSVAANSGSIVINLGAGTATINYSNIERFEFSADNFTGSPHSLELDSSDNTEWNYDGSIFEVTTTNNGYYVGVIEFEGSLGLNYQLDTTFQPILDMSNKNGLIIFDYQDADNYKYVRAYAKANKWTIGELVAGIETTLATLNETIDETAANPLQLQVTGVDGMTAELWSGGVQKASYTFSDPLNDGRFGIANNIAHTEFTLDMTPTNWSPYVMNYDQVFSPALMDEVVLTIISDAVDFENELLTITDVTTSTNGSLTDNGDGTLTYIPNNLFIGVDTYTVTVSDGTNETIGTVRFDVLPDL